MSKKIETDKRLFGYGFKDGQKSMQAENDLLKMQVDDLVKSGNVLIVEQERLTAENKQLRQRCHDAEEKVAVLGKALDAIKAIFNNFSI